MRERRPHIAAVVAAAGLVIASGSAFGATNLVQNPGFETGDFSSWTADGWVVVTSFGLITGPNSGTFFAAESCPNGGCTNTLSQTISTTPGDHYNLSFFLNIGTTTPTYELEVDWNGSSVETVGGGSGVFWANVDDFTTDLLATSSSTTFEIRELNAPSGIGIDDVSVTAVVPELSTWAMMGLGFASLGFAGYRARRATSAVA
jgi:hypothetical protein